jgi:hypothetical protein
LIEGLKKEYEEAVRREFAREEQARIKAQIREEEKVAREREKAVQEARRKETGAQEAVDRIQAALARARDAAEIERLMAELAAPQAQLKEAKENTQRAISNLELKMMKAGTVYVLSNMGSFGQNVFKVGMTRRPDPQERVDELGSASVPFEFDVHMMISCKDAPAVETALHHELHKYRVNKANPRKEFFRIDLETIRRIAETQPGEVSRFHLEPAAEQYRSSQITSDEDAEFNWQTNRSVMEENDSSYGDD